MATRKRRKRSKPIASTIKHEVYGILILIFSVIAVAGQGVLPGMGRFGRALSSICLYLAGNFYFVIPLIFGYIGLHVMIKRKFPDKWTARTTGVTLLILAVLTYSHIHLFSLLEPAGKMTFGEIIRQPVRNFSEALSKQVTSNEYKNMLGGGQIGALAYGLLYYFFDNLGAKLVDAVLFLIAIMYLTGLSYVRVFLKLRQFFRYVGRRLQRGFAETLYLLGKKRSTAQTASGTGGRKPAVAYAADIDLEDDLEETLRPAPGKRKKPVIFDMPAESASDVPPWEEEEPVVAAHDAESSQPDDELSYIREFEFKDFQDVALAETLPPAEAAAPEPPLSAAPVQGAESVPEEGESADDVLIDAPAADKPKNPYHLPPFSLLSRPAGHGKSGKRATSKPTRASWKRRSRASACGPKSCRWFAALP